MVCVLSPAYASIICIRSFFIFPGSSAVGQGKNAIRAQVRREAEAERKALEEATRRAEAYAGPKEVNLDSSPVVAVNGVWFCCPMIGPEVLPRKEMEAHIHEFLLSQLAEEPEITSSIMIHTLNKDQEKIRVCIETICKYLDNIIANPAEEKFQKIRLNNKAFKERISSLQGTEEFFQAAGFEMKLLPGPDGVEEGFYVLSSEKAGETDRMKTLKEILQSAEPIKAQLDRNLHVFHPSAKADQIKIPNEFYSISPEELKREQQLRSEAVEKLGMLRTKEMRERERLKELRRYRYCLLRIRFPDGVLLQGTFRSTDKLSLIREFVQENLMLDWVPFDLMNVTGEKLVEDLSIAELGLAPAAVLNFSYDATVLKEMAAQQGSTKITCYLKPEVMEQIRSLWSFNKRQIQTEVALQVSANAVNHIMLLNWDVGIWILVSDVISCVNPHCCLPLEESRDWMLYKSMTLFVKAYCFSHLSFYMMCYCIAEKLARCVSLG